MKGWKEENWKKAMNEEWVKNKKIKRGNLKKIEKEKKWLRNKFVLLGFMAYQPLWVI